MEPRQALDRLLSGTGLTGRFTSPTTVTLAAVPAAAGPAVVGVGAVAGAAPSGDPAVQLPTLQVMAGTERGWSPVRGYVANVSASGTKTDTPIVETPQSISVVTRDQVEAQAAQSVKQALRYTAGVAAESRADFTGFDILYSRGFGVDRYVDGMRLQGNSGFVTPQYDVFNLERIDVLRGPASVLYGQASPGGIVNLISRRPTATPVHEVNLQAGSYGNLAAGFDVGGPADADGRWLYRLTAIGRNDDTQVDNAQFQRFAIAPALTWRPDANTSLTFLSQYQRDPKAGLYNFVPSQGSLFSNPSGIRLPTSFYAGDPNFNRIDRTQYAIGYLFEHRTEGNWVIRQNLRYLHNDGNLDQVLPLSLSANGRTLNRYVQVDHESIGAFTLDNQVEKRFSTGPLSHTVLTGLDYQRTDTRQRLGQAVGPSLNLFAPVYGVAVATPPITTSTSQLQNQVGLYAQDEVRLGRLSLLLSGRQDWADTDTTNRLTAAKRTSQNDERFSWRAGLIYNFDFGLAPYVSYATSFQPTSGTSYAGSPFQPTTGKQYEVGLKYQMPNTNVLLTAAAFNIDQDNVLTTDPAHPGFNVQSGSVRSRGVEFEAKASLARGLDVIAAYAYTDATVTRSNTANLGKRPLFTPQHIASVWGDYTIQGGSARGLGFGGGVRYIGPTFGNDVNTLEVRDYTLVDALIHFDLGSLSNKLEGARLSLNATNLFDRTYVSNCTNATNCLYGLRRTILANLNYRW